MRRGVQKKKGRSRWHGLDLSGKKNNFHLQYTARIGKCQEIRVIKIKIAECEEKKMERTKIFDAAAGAVIRDKTLENDVKMEVIEYLLELKRFHEEIGFKRSREDERKAARYAEII